LLLPLAIAFALLAVLVWKLKGDTIGGVGATSLLRTSLLLGAVWLAWPSLQRPATWLPPGISAVILGGIIACAMQPKLAFVLVPLVGSLIAFAGVLRAFRGQR
jgi:hypothetical protein